jgi:hypothetical protein
MKKCLLIEEFDVSPCNEHINENKNCEECIIDYELSKEDFIHEKGKCVICNGELKDNGNICENCISIGYKVLNRLQ